jgi:hypothetical protein
MKDKKIIVWVLMLVFGIFCAAAVKNMFKLETTQQEWIVVETCTSDGNEPSDLAVGERTWLTISAISTSLESGGGSEGDAEIEAKRIAPAWNMLRFRCIGISDNNSVTHQIYFGTLKGNNDCEFVKAGQLAWTIGTQASATSGYEMADTLTVTSYCWPKSWSSSNPANNLVAEAAIDCIGADMVVIVPTTSACNSRLLMKGF